MTLPPLPIPVIQPSELVEKASGILGALYLREQMKDYGELCRLSALEEAAVFFEAKNQGWHTDTDASVVSEIRGLK